MEDEPREFLPPEPAGPEPELGQTPAVQPPPPWPPAAPAGYPPPQQYAPPPGQPYQGWQPPPPGYPPQGWQQPPPGWPYQPRPAEPDNGSAVAGFVLSLIAGGLLLISFGTSSIISIACAIFGLVYSRKGKKRIQAGETTKHAGLAQAGWIISIISLVLAVIATLAYIALIVAYATDGQFRHDINNGSGDNNTVRATVGIATAAGRALLG